MREKINEFHSVSDSTEQYEIKKQVKANSRRDCLVLINRDILLLTPLRRRPRKDGPRGGF